MPVPGPIRFLRVDRLAGKLIASTERGVPSIDPQSLKTTRVMAEDIPMWTVSAGSGLGHEF